MNYELYNLLKNGMTPEELVKELNEVNEVIKKEKEEAEKREKEEREKEIAEARDMLIEDYFYYLAVVSPSTFENAKDEEIQKIKKSCVEILKSAEDAVRNPKAKKKFPGYSSLFFDLF